MKRWRLSRLATADLNSAWTFIADEDSAAADRWLTAMYEVFVRFTRMPQLGRSAPECGTGTRVLHHGRYSVFYRSNDGVLEIARVLHGAQKFSGLL